MERVLKALAGFAESKGSLFDLTSYANGRFDTWMKDKEGTLLFTCALKPERKLTLSGFKPVVEVWSDISADSFNPYYITIDPLNEKDMGRFLNNVETQIGKNLTIRNLQSHYRTNSKSTKEINAAGDFNAAAKDVGLTHDIDVQKPLVLKTSANKPPRHFEL